MKVPTNEVCSGNIRVQDTKEYNSNTCYKDILDEVPDSLESPNFPETNEPEEMAQYSTLKTTFF